MPFTTFDRAWNTLLTTTMDNYRPTLIDQVHKGITLLYALTQRGRGQGVRYENGGHHLSIPVIYQKNPNVGTMSGYDRLNLAPTEEATMAFESWANGYGSVGISREEMRQNNGQHARANLLRVKMDVLETSLKEFIEQQLMVGTPSTAFLTRGNGGKDFLPLGALITKDPEDASSPKVHNIDPITNDWWRNKESESATQGAEKSWPVFRAEMTNVINNCRRGSTGDGPDFAIMDQLVYEKVENGIIGHQQLSGIMDQQTASLGFGGLSWKGCTFMWSEYMPGWGINDAASTTSASTATAQSIFFINSKWLELVIDTETDFIVTPFQEPVDQLAVWAKMLFRAQLTVTQRRKHGLLWAINPANILITY